MNDMAATRPGLSYFPPQDERIVGYCAPMWADLIVSEWPLLASRCARVKVISSKVSGQARDELASNGYR